MLFFKLMEIMFVMVNASGNLGGLPRIAQEVQFSFFRQGFNLKIFFTFIFITCRFQPLFRMKVIDYFLLRSFQFLSSFPTALTYCYLMISLREMLKFRKVQQ